MSDQTKSKSLSADERVKLVSEIVKSELGTVPTFSEDRSTGYSGSVYVVEADVEGERKKIVVKLTAPEDEPPLEKESPSRRVYSTKYSNFNPAHKLIEKNGFPLAKIYAQGTSSPTIPYNYQILSFLEGTSVREALERRDTAESAQLHGVTGEIFGRLHGVTRSYDGWIDQEKPYPSPWRSAVEQAISHQLETCLVLNTTLREKSSEFHKFLRSRFALWTDPKEFVLSDIDGFQGMAKFEDRKWEITGLIDIEDHKFCDPRMMLAGYEVALYYEDLQVPESFWAGYKKYKSVDPNYSNLKGLFQLYYLLSWLQIPYEGHERIESEDTQRIIARFEELISKLISEKA